MNEKGNKTDSAKREEETLVFWQKNDIFQKSLEKNKDGEPFVFYDGPPFATGLPHYGHLLAGTIKDVIPRYQNMRGKLVRRQWGWDCHGLPIENLIEEELGLKEKKDIEKLGVGKFNEAARASVLRYDTEWKEIVPRMGRWIDMENAYRTMDWQYTESIWWAFKELHEKGLIYEGHKSMHICPRCETTLAISEVTQGYKDVTDISVTVKFELKDEPHTYLLAWTTTPWTLPGNVALAVNPDVDYVKIKAVYSIKIYGKGTPLPVTHKNEYYILSKEILKKYKTIRNWYEFGGYMLEIVEEIKGKDLIGKSYKPVFDYYANTALEHSENAWKVYAADFVDTESGTGIVHIAPAFGEDDMALGQEYDLPFIQHVGMDGRFKEEVTDFSGQLVKPKENPQEADIEIIKNLAHRGLLFAKEKIVHPYPHCWRCETPLLNYAASSWFVKVTAMKDRMVALNKKIKWVPEYVGKARFANWLAEARDWAISRSRYWGAPIPVWKCDECERVKVIGSMSDIRAQVATKNQFIVMRHGEAEHNILNQLSGRASNPHHLTDKGKNEAREAAKKLKDKNIDIIFVSPFARTKDTADIVAENIGLSGADIIIDERLREVDVGELEGKTAQEYHDFFSSQEEKFYKPTPGGDTLTDMKGRLGDFLFEINTRYEHKNILVITHEYGAWLLSAVARGFDARESVRIKEAAKDDFVKTGEIMELPFTVFPHNKQYELDLHRPYIDEISFSCECGSVLRRVPEVFDCWFESGSMPYAQFHYMGHKDTDEGKRFWDNFPADFIAEGLDQTRGWFYNMLVLSTGLFDETAYKNVVVNGLVLAENGQKMSKRLKNYPDPLAVAETYGADALRYYLMSSPSVRAEPLNFSEKGVEEVYKKVLGRLFNVVSFYELYPAGKSDTTSDDVLDVWVMSRLSKLAGEVSGALERYELDRATRPVGEFVDDVSTWYVRRSRERLKEGDEGGRATFRFILQEFSKIIAPIMPFAAENIYQRVCAKKESVHIEDWPAEISSILEISAHVLEDMEEIRRVVSFGLEARATANIKVRQPLRELRIKPALSADRNQESGIKNKKELLQLIKDEVNVKEIVFDESLESEVLLDIEITHELQQEGEARELIRSIQELRKQNNLSPFDVITLIIHTDDIGKNLIADFEDEIRKAAKIKEINYEENVNGSKIDSFSTSFWIEIRK